jgi:fluoroquinolone transport system ATP-binding protein
MNVASELCDRVAFIVDGRLALIDSPRRLKLKYGSRTVRVEYMETSGMVRADFPLDDIGGNEDFLKILRTRRIETLHSLEATLEDIFIKTTGQTLEAEPCG